MEWIKKFAKIRYILIFFITSILCLTVITIIQIRLADHNFPQILDMQVAFSYDQAFSQINRYSEAGIILYTWFQAMDVLFQVGYGMLFSCLTAFFIMKLFPKKPWMLWLSAAGIGAACFDLMENIGIFIMIRIHPEPYRALSAIVSAAGVIKIALFYLCVAFCIICTIILWAKRIFRN